MAAASAGFWRDKLKVPHPVVQRHAVRAIFECLRQKRQQKHMNKELNENDEEAMVLECLSWPAGGAVVDEAVKELWGSFVSARELLYSPDHALRILQVSLEHAASESVPVIIRGIGFICRFLVKDAKNEKKYSSILTSFKATELHPFVRAFESREDSHLDIVHEVLVMLSDNDNKDYFKELHFLRPCINHILLHHLASAGLCDVSRELRYSLASMTMVNLHLCPQVLQLLRCAVLCFPSATLKETNNIFLALRDLVDALEGAISDASWKSKAESYIFVHVIQDMLQSIMEIAQHIQIQKRSLLPILNLFGRVLRLWELHAYELGFWHWISASLSYMLGGTDLEEEQLVLIDLASSLLRINSDKKLKALPTALMWVFPVMNSMSSSSARLQKAAGNVLQNLEAVLGKHWSEKGSYLQVFDYKMSATLSLNGDLSASVTKILLWLYSTKGGCNTWISKMSSLDKCAVQQDKNVDGGVWLEKLSIYIEVLRGQIDKKSSRLHCKTHSSKDLILWLCMLVSALMTHPVHNAVVPKLIHAIVKCNPIVSVSLLPVFLFYIKALKKQQRADTRIVFGVLKMLPLLAMHPMASSVISELLQPMISQKENQMLKSFATRLLCKSFEVSGKSLPHLRTVLDECCQRNEVTEPEMNLCRAASLLDICKKDAEHGIELVLLIQGCLENKMSSVRALGLLSLSFLCEKDLIDFYTAWEVISDMFSDVPFEAVEAESLCQFLENGALDAAAHVEIAHNIIEQLWKAVALSVERKWWRVQEKALRALSSYDVNFLISSFEDKDGKHAEFLLSNVAAEASSACVELVIKVLLYEHKARPRGQPEAKIGSSRLEKLLVALPRIMNNSFSKETISTQFPVVWLLLCPYLPQSVNISFKENDNIQIKNVRKWMNDQEELFCGIANQIDLQGNLVHALMHCQSWLSFIKNWLISLNNIILTSSMPTPSNDGKAAKDIMRVLSRLSKESIPRVAEHAILALAVLYEISRATPDQLIDPLVESLEDNLCQDGHEYLMWTSAIALGIVARSCNPTSFTLKVHIARSLLKLLYSSDADLVRGACAMSLGFLCHNIIASGPNYETNFTGTMTEQVSVLATILERFLKLIRQGCPEMHMFIKDILNHDFIQFSTKTVSFHFEESDYALEWGEDCFWTLSGLAMGLGSSSNAIEAVGLPDLVSSITKFLIQLLDTFQSDSCNHKLNYIGAGACLSLPSCLETCLHLDMLDDVVEFVLEKCKHLLNAFKDSASHDHLQMFICLGFGNLVAAILYYRKHNISLMFVQEVIEALKLIATCQMSPMDALGGFIGLANIFGAGSALLAPQKQPWAYRHVTSSQLLDAQRMSPVVSGPLLCDSRCKDLVQTLVQELLNYTLHASDAITRSFAAWSLALIRKAFMEIDNTYNFPSQHTSELSYTSVSKLNLWSLPPKSTLFMLCTWVLNTSGNDQPQPFPCKTASLVFHCLRKVPKIPLLDWGFLVQQIMHKAEIHVGSIHSESIDGIVSELQVDLWKECFFFSISHAPNQPPLLSFLDDLCGLARMVSLPPLFSGLLMEHMVKLGNIFSQSRMEKFFFDSVELSSRSSRSCSKDGWRQLNISFWKGFYVLIMEWTERLDIIKFFQVAGHLVQTIKNLPLFSSEYDLFKTDGLLCEEWSAALDCIARAPKEWLLEFLQFEWKKRCVVDESARKTLFIMCEMVVRGSLTSPMLLEPSRFFCNQETLCDLELLWIANALKDKVIEEKQEWLNKIITLARVCKNPENGIMFLAFMSSCWSTCASLLLVDSQSAISSLPFTFSSLICEEQWRGFAKQILDGALMLLERDDGATPAFVYLKRACRIGARHLRLPADYRLKLLESACFQS